jgi:small-conductance mechanosensitive channel
MNEILQQIAEILELGPGAEGRLIRSAAIILILVVLHIVFLRLIRSQDIQFRYRWRKISTYVGVVLGIILVGRVWFEGVQTVATFIGILGAGLVIALRDMVTNIAAWFFILWRRPFVVGDRIQIGEHRGDVIDKRIFQFTLLEIGNWVDADQSTGRIIHVPNGRIFVEPVANYTAGLAYIWNEIPVTITFESDWKAAREILLDIARRHGEHLTEEAERRR